MSLDTLPSVRDVPVVTAAQMAEADRVASTELGIPLEMLMENASRQVAVAVRAYLGRVAGRDVIALSGTGNNGGDALGALRHLRGWGARVEAFVTGTRESLRPLAALQYGILERLGVALHDTNAVHDRALVERMKAADVVVDGLLGYSTKGPPRGETARIVMLAYGRRIVAVDIPSGLDPDTGEKLGAIPAGAIHASVTVTLGLPKVGLLRPAAREWVGDLVLADIGIPAKAYAGLGIATGRLFADGDLVRIIP